MWSPRAGLRARLGVLLLACWWRHGWSVAGDGEVQSTTAFGYVLTDPTDFDPALKGEATFDQRRSDSECFCGESVHRNLWLKFYSELQEGLAEDPSFSGEWVHRLCGVAYPVIFRVISVDPEDDTFTMHSDCPAGILAMVVVCAQSSAMQAAQAQGGHASEGAPPDGAGGGPSRWLSTERVVREEGRAVTDMFGAVPLQDCLAACERTPGCRSLAHGPNGCHLKSRCVSAGDRMVEKGEQGDDYRTHYLSPCPGAATAASGSSDLQAGVQEALGKLEELKTMMGFALRALEFCLHCLDASPWPFTLDEVMENYALATEAPASFRWARGWPAVGSAGAPVPMTDTLRPPKEPAWPLPPVRRLLLRAQVRWTRGLEMEAAFWRQKLSLDPEENDSMERLRRWLATGEVNWFLNGDDLCSRILDALARRAAPEEPQSTARSPRILNAGSGPFAPGPLECALPRERLPRTAGSQQAEQSGLVPWRVPVVASDGLARFYNLAIDEHGMTPQRTPLQCPSEKLHTCFPPGHFDVVHMRNSLDHAFDPLLAITRMLQIARPGGWVLLRHARNEGVAGQFRNGLHQWAFDVTESVEQGTAFLIWCPEMRVDVTSYLLNGGLAAEVRTELRAHPSPEENPDERYVWVDIRKPTVAEASKRLARAAEEAVDAPLTALG